MNIDHMQDPPKVFIALPSHDGRIDVRTAGAAYNATQKYNSIVSAEVSSLLAFGFNNLWCRALNARAKHNIKWFAMLHSDIAPEALWLDKMIAIAEENGADLLSAVVPIKSADGITSTAITTDDGQTLWKRLTQTEVHAKDFPKTFDVVPPRKLLVNTGCMIVRLDQLWSDEVFFTITDRIERQFNQYVARVESEDWLFSRMVAEKGGKVMATTEVQLLHIGQTPYSNQMVWGKAVDPLSTIG